MKLLRLLALSIAATAWLAAAAFACPGAKSANASSCGSKASATKTASAQGNCSAHGATATAAAQNGCPASAAGNCPMSAEACKAKMASGGCPYADGATAAAAGNCTMHSAAAHGDCAVCTDEAACGEDLTQIGAHEQVVGLRNGTMILYTADNPENVRELQAAVALYNNRVISALRSSKAKLCTSCKRLRGALASGKLVRQVVNVERGCQLIITSSDRSIVRQVHATTDAQVAARTHS